MKAKIKRVYDGWQWYIIASNGQAVIRSYIYTRRYNAKRGLKKFLEDISLVKFTLDGMLDG